MEDSQINRIYEICYYLNQNLDEGELSSQKKNVEDIISSCGGAIENSTEPKKIRLSYPIKHQRFVFMCVNDFNADPEKIEAINSKLKLNGNLVRFLIIQKPTGKELRLTSEHKVRKTYTQRPETAQVHQKKEITQEEEKEMEKKIEDVLEKI